MADRIGSAIGGGGGARAEDAAALGDLLLEVVGVERVVRCEETPAPPVARDAEQAQQQLLLRRQRRRRAVVHRRRCFHRFEMNGRSESSGLGTIIVCASETVCAIYS